MVTRLGDQYFYDNFQMGCVAPDGDDPYLEAQEFALAFTDRDNNEIHLFKIHKDKWPQFVSLINQTIQGRKIEVAGPQDIPRGA